MVNGLASNQKHRVVVMLKDTIVIVDSTSCISERFWY